MPVHIGNYTNFYTSIPHATHVESMFNLNNPLTLNYKQLPIDYHGRASSVVISGTSIRWLKGQLKKESGQPIFDFSDNLDYELELGALIGECRGIVQKPVSLIFNPELPFEPYHQPEIFPRPIKLPSRRH